MRGSSPRIAGEDGTDENRSPRPTVRSPGNRNQMPVRRYFFVFVLLQAFCAACSGPRIDKNEQPLRYIIVHYDGDREAQASRWLNDHGFIGMPVDEARKQLKVNGFTECQSNEADQSKDLCFHYAPPLEERVISYVQWHISMSLDDSARVANFVITPSIVGF